MRLAPIARLLFSSLDDPVLEYQALLSQISHDEVVLFKLTKVEEGQKIEPYWHHPQWCSQLYKCHWNETQYEMDCVDRTDSVLDVQIRLAPKVCSNYSDDPCQWLWRYRPSANQKSWGVRNWRWTGTGWSTSVPNYNPLDIIVTEQHLRLLIFLTVGLNCYVWNLRKFAWATCTHHLW